MMELSDQIKTFKDLFSKQENNLGGKEELVEQGELGDNKIHQNHQMYQKPQSTNTVNLFSKTLTGMDRALLCYLEKPLTDKQFGKISKYNKPDKERKKLEDNGLVVPAGKEGRATLFRITESGKLQIEEKKRIYERRIKLEEELRLKKEEEKKEREEREKQTAKKRKLLDEQINILWQEIHSELLEAVRTGKKSLTIPFAIVAKCNPTLASLLLDTPEDTIKAAEMSLQQMDLDPNKIADFNIRFSDLPDEANKRINNIRSKHLGKLKQSRVSVVTKTDCYSLVTSAQFECPSCGNNIPVLQLDDKFREPNICRNCGRKGRFRLLKRDLIDTAKITVREPLNDIINQGSSNRKIGVILSKDLCRPKFLERINPGTELEITYIPKENFITLPTGGRSNRLNTYLEANNITILDGQEIIGNFTDEEINSFFKATEDKRFLDKFIKSAFPKHHGDKDLLYALCLQLVSGNFNHTDKKERIHIAICTEPGMNKSELLLKMTELAPISAFSVAKGNSNAGLTGAVEKDEHTGQRYLEPGLLTLNNRGIVCIDEFDKIPEEDQTDLNQPMAQGIISKHKAGVQVDNIPADCRILAALNPKKGKFSDGNVRVNDIKIELSTLSRFWLYVRRDIPHDDTDRSIARIILSRDKEKIPPFSHDWVKRFILYVRTHIRAGLREEEAEKIETYYATVRGLEEEKYEKIIAPRHVEILQAFCILSAKIHLRTETNEKDLAIAQDLYSRMLEPFGWDARSLQSYNGVVK